MSERSGGDQDQDQYQYEEPIPAPMSVELYQTDEYGERIDEFGEGIDPSKEIVVKSEQELSHYLKTLQKILQKNNLISERDYELLDRHHEVAFTSLKVDGYDDHKKVAEWDSHENIDDVDVYREYLGALARRIDEASDSPDGVFHDGVGDILDVMNKVGDELSLNEAKAEVRRINPPEELQEP